MTAVIHSKSEHIDVRASTPVKLLLQEAARVAHKNVSEFLLDVRIIAANQTGSDAVWRLAVWSHPIRYTCSF